MLQCQACKSWNENGAAFCIQCGQSVGGGKRRWGLRHTLVLIAGLAGIQAAVFFHSFQQPVEPVESGVPQGQPRSVAVMKPAVEGETPAPLPVREGGRPRAGRSLDLRRRPPPGRPRFAESRSIRRWPLSSSLTRAGVNSLSR